MFRHSIRLVHSAEFDVWSCDMDDDHAEPALFVKVGDDLVLSIRPEYPSYDRCPVDANHVRFARELVEASRQYLTELERAYEHDKGLEEQAALIREAGIASVDEEAA